VLLHKTLRSSTFRLAFVYVGLFSSAILALLGYVYWTTASFVDQRLADAIAAEQRLLRAADDGGGREALLTQVRQRTADGFFRDWVYLVVDSGSAYAAGNLRSWPPELSDRAGSGEITLSDGASGAIGGRAVRVVYSTLADGAHLLVGRDAGDLERLRNRTATALAAAALLFISLAAAAGISTSRRSVARIETINASTRKIMQAGLGERIPLRGTRDEWDELADNLNTMLARIEELTESTRQVADNVAHDLRTPLTHLRGRLEKALAHRPDLAQYRILVGGAIVELDALLQTFTSLLRISRIEMGDQTAGFGRLDLSAIAREVVDLFDPTAEEASVRLRWSESAPVLVFGDRDLLFDAIANLIDNAIKHGGRGGTVRVRVESDGAEATLSVADGGPGIPEEEREHVLQRFYRLERSRHNPGNGLGLSLVAAVVKLHRARIDMRENGPGLRIELTFPEARAGFTIA
jgi:signal transduction histidine kinase